MSYSMKKGVSGHRQTENNIYKSYPWKQTKINTVDSRYLDLAYLE